mmetsp:Transcript_45667/g.118121  ORF Transcript_45667/g.118121 Transcript_45667/m.118121 type:complete len:419 (+) Transcript_45667:56-1312(+)|eukprot:CAMPEP_0195104532 /NCGR_PEP_ID=MMETSP0448-20130528/73147_1 /TAXON_ID=66468 /ORGANISM="Heterocapsa triquestra, Strain CCMP 448" /LENGTH=418 /DNA_ID=CAMNT_0040140381 /DNA_START=56 /DNA_END=1312 /DNA_ORIENTATION=+
MAPFHVAAALLVLPAACAAAARFRHRADHAALAGDDAGDVDFDAYMKTYGRVYEPGSEQHAMRKSLFQRSVEEVQRHNVAGHRWKAAVNALSDRTAEELAELRGYRRSRSQPNTVSSANFLGSDAHVIDLAKLPKELTWAHKLAATTEVQDQSSCGSCWAFAATSVLRAHTELFQRDRTCSVQQVVSCTPNPNQCGGDGGCGGATAELAMNYILKTGCLPADKMPYTAMNGECPRQLALNNHKEGTLGSMLAELSGVETGKSFGMLGFQKLPENQLEPLLSALYTMGPVVVSLAASGNWNSYYSGIYDHCSKDAEVNHAVMLVGFGEDADGTKYWTIQNSWGPRWGEGGFIRVIRYDHADEKQHCGIDRHPEVGSGCKGGPVEVPVCGHCGLLSDMVVPHFALANGSWWQTHGGLRTL